MVFRRIFHNFANVPTLRKAGKREKCENKSGGGKLPLTASESRIYGRKPLSATVGEHIDALF